MSTAPSPMVQMYAPDGTLGSVPYERMHDALQAGGKMAVNMRAPDGTAGVVPADKVQDAVKAGGKVVPFDLETQPIKEGFLSHAGQYLKSMVPTQAPSLTDAIIGPASTVAKQLYGAGKQAVDSYKQGHGLPYSATAGAATAVGVNVPRMEQAAAQGDTGGVLGEAAVPAAMAIAPAAIGAAGKLIPKGLTQSAAQRLYQSALKPSPASYSTAEVGNMVQTGLDNAIPVSASGAEKLSTLVSDLNDKVKAQIQLGANRGVTIDPNKIAARMDSLKGKFATQVNPEADLAAIDASKQEFLRNWGKPQAQSTPLQAVPTEAWEQPVKPTTATMRPDGGKSWTEDPSTGKTIFAAEQALKDRGFPPENIGMIRKMSMDIPEVSTGPRHAELYAKMLQDAIRNHDSTVASNSIGLPSSASNQAASYGIPADQAQALKQGTYQQLKGKAYGEMRTARRITNTIPRNSRTQRARIEAHRT
jgi:hypothetical protein